MGEDRETKERLLESAKKEKENSRTVYGYLLLLCGKMGENICNK